MTARVVHRLYWDFEKEERWLNEMAAKGWNLVRYSLGSYRFESGEPGTWVYRIELLPGGRRRAASREYLTLLRDTGVETVATYMRWVYLRRLAARGAFELFTDLESRIAHYRRVLRLFAGLLAALVAVEAGLIVNNGGGVAFVAPLVIVLAGTVVLAVQTVRLQRRVRSLTAQRQVYE